MPESADKTLTIGSKSSMGVVQRTDSEIAEANLSDVESEVASAEDFVVYGKASVEVFDDDTVSQKIEMSAFDEALEQFFAQGGNISYQHKDVMVGKALESHTLDSDVSVKVGDETKEFSAGDTLETKVEGDTLWLVAHIYGRGETAGSDASVMTRLGAYRGDLDGFSVTIKNKEYENTSNGQVIKEIDFHSVTVGTGDQIKNPDSLFGVAEFKLTDYLSRHLTVDTKRMEMDILNKLRGASTEAIAEKTITHALTNEPYDLGESAKATADEESVEDVQAKAESRLSEVQEKAEDRDDLVALLADMTDLDSDEINQALDTMLDSDDTEEKEYDDKEMDEEEEEMDEDGEKADMDDVAPHAEAIADMMDVPVSRVMDMLSGMESEEEDVEPEKAETETESKGLTEDEVEELVDAKMEDAVESISESIDEMEGQVAETVAEQVTEKLSTGSTPESDSAEPTDDGTRNLLDEW